jgi:small-conductance mechanosensitive channel
MIVDIVSIPDLGLIHSGILANVTNNAGDPDAQMFVKLTLGKIARGLLVVTVAYLLLLGIEKFNSWLSEKVARRFRLMIRQSLPFWRAAILLGTVIILMRMFLRLSTNNLLALTGTISVALGFAFKDYASSLIAGFIALFEGPYRVGDRIQIGEHYGEIISYGLRGMRLQTPTDNVVTIPHNKLWTEPIANSNNGALEAQVVTDFYLAHDVDIDLVIKILYQAAYTSKFTQLKLPILVTVRESSWATHFMLKFGRNEILHQLQIATTIVA